MKFNEKNVSAFSKIPPYDLDGILHKLGDINRTWQKRYFILKGNLLFYFEKPIDKEPLGLIILEGCRVELCQETDHPYTFEIIFGTSNRKYTLSAESEYILSIWMKAIACSSCEYKKALLDELQSKLERFTQFGPQVDSDSNNLQHDSQLDIVEFNAPKAPERRRNPFNRPAPPPPAIVSAIGTIVGVTEGEKTKPDFVRQIKLKEENRNLSGNTAIIVGEDAVVNTSHSTEIMWPDKNNLNAAIKNNDDEILGVNSNNTLRYNWETFGEEPENSFGFQHGRGAGATTMRCATATKDEFSFRTVHETFKKIIFDDINEHRAKKEHTTKPLIQF